MIVAQKKIVSGKSSRMPVSCRRLIILFLGIAILAAGSSLAQTASSSSSGTTLEAVTTSQPLRDGIELQAGSATLRITALRDDIVRVRISPDALPEDASWAVLPASRTKSVDVQPIDDATSVGFRTAALDVRVDRNPLRLVIRDLAGNIISADVVGPRKVRTRRVHHRQANARRRALLRPR